MARPAKKPRASAASDDDATDYSDSPGPSDKRRQSSGKTAKAKQRKSTGANSQKNKKRSATAPDSSDPDDDGDSDQDDDEDGGATGKGKKAELNDAEKKEHIQSIVRYILFNEFHRRVLKREDIVKNVLTDGRGRHFTALMAKVQRVLRDVMGMELILLRHRETATGKNPPKAWILRSTLPQPLLRHAATFTSTAYAAQLPFPYDAAGGEPPTTKGRTSLKEELGHWMIDERHLKSSRTGFEADGGDDEPEEEEDDDAEEVHGGVMRDAKREEGAAYGVLGTILALILVNGKVLGDDQLVSYLRRLDLTPTTPIPLSLASPHPDSLTLSAYLNLLTKQQYLERAKTAAGGGGPGAGTQTHTQASGAGRSQCPTRTQRATADGIQEAGDPSIEWRWGARAEAELGEEGVARFVEYVFKHGNKDPAGAGAGGKRGKTGEKFLREVARAAGTKTLQNADDIEGGGFA